MTTPSPCPICGRQPTVEECGPWPRHLGPAPWVVYCYQSDNREHYVGGDGDTEADAMASWEAEARRRTVKRSLTLPLTPTPA